MRTPRGAPGHHGFSEKLSDMRWGNSAPPRSSESHLPGPRCRAGLWLLHGQGGAARTSQLPDRQGLSGRGGLAAWPALACKLSFVGPASPASVLAVVASGHRAELSTCDRGLTTQSLKDLLFGPLQQTSAGLWTGDRTRADVGQLAREPQQQPTTPGSVICSGIRDVRLPRVGLHGALSWHRGVSRFIFPHLLQKGV